MSLAEPLAERREIAANPFPGLRPFELHESDLFFGRQDNIRELLGRLRRTRFLAVVGASGCGKSSLIRAGLLAALQDGFLAESGGRWRMACLRPGEEPIRRLARALHRPEALGDFYPASEDLAALETALRRGALGLVEAAREAPLPSHDRLFILVDQFEEIFRFGSDPERGQSEARAFVKLLLAAIAQRELPLYVALTLRSDFLGNCSALPGLPEAINQSLYLVPQMSRAQLREAIKGPAELCGARITERLVNRLLNNLEDSSDQLPILQHALMRLWALWSEGPLEAPLDLDHYDRIGGLREALHRHAEEVFDGLDERGRWIAECLFRNLTETTEERQVVRRPASAGRIARAAGASPEEVVAVVDRFRAPGRSFLMPPCDVALTPETVIDISHESLIRQWARLEGWAAAQATEADLARQIAKGAALWQEKKREPSYLFPGARLAEAEEWMKSHAEELGDLERDFIEEGARLRDQQLLARHESELPQKVAEEAAARGRALTKKTAYVYISASRHDWKFTRELREALQKAGVESWMEDLDIVASRPLLEQAFAAIDAADAVLCVLSPDSFGSELCRAEIDHALKRNKRLIPVLSRKLPPGAVHPALEPLHWLDLRQGLSSQEDVDRLLSAIGSDLEWTKMHSRLLWRAAEWQDRGRDESLLLRGSDLKEAEEWLTQSASQPRDPKVTEAQADYLRASRQVASRQQRLTRGMMISLLMLALFLIVLTAFQTWTANRQREAAETSQRAADEVKRRLLFEWGYGLNAGHAPQERSVQQSFQAAEEIRKLVAEEGDETIAERRQKVRVEYYADLDRELRTTQLAHDLRGLGFTIENRPRQGRTETNAIWFGSAVAPEDVQQIALFLIRAGWNIKYIACFRDSSGRENLVQIGGRPRSATTTAPPLTVEQIQRSEGIEECQTVSDEPLPA